MFSFCSCSYYMSEKSSFFVSRQVNISHWRDGAKCWEKLASQKTYIILMQSDDHVNDQEERSTKAFQKSVDESKAILKSKSDKNFGGAVEFSQELERKLLDALGKCPLLLLMIYHLE